MAFSNNSSNSNLKMVVVTDLDGSLLDHDDYSYTAAESQLRQLEEMAVPVVLCTSKTRAEVEELRSQLHNRYPFIVENGAAIFIPRGYFGNTPADCIRSGDYDVREFCPPRAHWLHLLEQAKQEFPRAFDHFDAMSVEKVAEVTGLTLPEAARAKQRGYGEPLQWLASDAVLQAFSQWFTERGARVLRGGRFVHVSGQSDKGQALSWLVGCYKRVLPGKSVVSIALGDSHNDVDMLERANCAVVIRSPAHAAPKLARSDNVYFTDGVGPVGWAEGIDHWLGGLNSTGDGK